MFDQITYSVVGFILGVALTAFYYLRATRKDLAHNRKMLNEIASKLRRLELGDDGIYKLTGEEPPDGC